MPRWSRPSQRARSPRPRSTIIWPGCFGWPVGSARSHGIPPEAERTLGPQVEPTDPSLRLALRTLAAAGMVLLKGQEVLPLDEAAIGATAPLVIVGRHAIQTALQGGGSASVRPPHEISIADGLTEALGAARLRVVDGVTVRQNPPAAAVGMIMDPQTGTPGVRITSFDDSGQATGVHRQRGRRTDRWA